jgi:hypothetical protein
MAKPVQVPYKAGISFFSRKATSFSFHLSRHMDTEKQTVTANHKQHTYHMSLTTDTQTFRSPLHTVTLHVTVFNLMRGYRVIKRVY